MGTKIVVIKLKELLKNIAFAVIGLILIAVLVYFFIPKSDKSEARYSPGTYSSHIILHSNPVQIDVTVSENEILDIQMLNMNDTQEVFYPLFNEAIEEVVETVLEYQSVDVETTIDKSVTTSILLDAIDSALEKAK